MTNQKTRIESDTMGEIEVSTDKYWGAQTQRSLLYFKPTTDLMPRKLIKALLIVKIAAAKANAKLGILDKSLADAIVQAGEEALDGKFDVHFPLSMWQTGSGTQSNMNVNEVLSNRAIEILGGVMGSKKPVHPNDHVNLGQSSNDCFPTAMNIASVLAIHSQLLPVIDELIATFEKKKDEFKGIIKTGRTHMQDATPITLGQEFSGYLFQLKRAKKRIKIALEEVHYLAQGGTAVGTGLNAIPGFESLFVKEVNDITNLTFKSSTNKFYSLATHDDLVNLSGSLNSLAVALTKIANDIRLMGSGPRTGIAELQLPENEPGSSIMPGKVNPTQVEALTMGCAQVMACHYAVSLGGMQGHLELNVYKPLIVYNILKAVDILSTTMEGFSRYCLQGIEPDIKRINYLMRRSLMLVTGLTKHIGYDKAAQIAKLAHKKYITLKEAAIELGYVREEDFDKWVDPKDMV
jgi:fumarate hydratase class II